MEEENEVASSYDKNFLNSLDNNYKKFNTPKGNRLATNNAFDKEVHRVNFDSSNQSKLREGINPFLDQFVDLNAKDPYNEIRATSQSDTEKIGKGLARAGLKAATEIAKLPGVIGGIVATPWVKEGEGYDTAFNNVWIKSIDALSDTVNEELLPIYTRKALKEGDLMTNIMSTDFWATEGADGLGFMLGMMAPGAIINKLGFGAKLLSGSRKAAQAMEMAGKTEQAVSILNKAGLAGKAIDVATGAAVNTIFESGSEAAGVGNDLDDKKPEYMKQNVARRIKELNPTGIPEMIQAPMELVQNPDGTQSMHSKGLIPNPEFEKIKQQAYDLAESDFKEQRALAMRDTFKSNLAVLIIPNLLMSKMLFGKAESKLVKEVEKTGLKGFAQKAGKAAVRTGEAFASEGFLEEASQTTAQNMFTEKAMNNELKIGDGADGGFFTGGLNDFTLGEATDAYLDTVSSNEGQKAIFLGGIMAAPMVSISGARNDDRQRKETNAILDKMDLSISSFNTIFDNDIYRKDPNDENKFLYKKDEDGNDTTERLIDRKKVLEVAKSLNYNEAQAARLDWAISTGNTKVIQELKEKAVFDMVMPAIFNGKAGLEALEDKLNNDSKFTEIANRDADPSNKEKSSDFVRDTLEAAKHLQLQNEKFEDFGGDLIKLEDERATPEDKKRYLNALNNQYLNVKYQQYNSEKKLAKLEEKRDKLFQELNIQRDVNDIAANARQVNNAMSTNPLLKSVMEEITEVKQSIDKNVKDVNGLWSGKSAIAESFKNYIDSLQKQEEETSDEKVAEAEQVIDKVNNATNKKELEDAVNDSKINPEDAQEIDNEFATKDIEEEDFYTEENQMISDEIDLKRAKAEEQRKSAVKEVVAINDTLEYLNGLLNNVIDQSLEDVSDLNKEINNRIKLFNSSTKSKTKKGQVNSKQISELKDEVKDVFKLANDIQERVRQLEANKLEIQKLSEFLSYKIEYYNKLKDQGLDFNALQKKIDKLESKTKTLDKLISSIEKTINSLLNSLKEIFNIVTGLSNRLNDFEENSEFTSVTSEELKEMIQDGSAEGYARFNNKLNSLTEDLNEALEHGEITQDVYDDKIAELNNLVKTLEKTSIQLDILKDLFSNEKTEEVGNKKTVENPYIQQKINEKQAELDIQEEEELQAEKEEQRELEEDKILNEEPVEVENTAPSIVLDNEGEFESESIPNVDNEINETSPSDFDKTEKDVEKELDTEVSGARIISTDMETGEPLYDNLIDFVEYERTPRDKSNDVVEFELGDAKGDILEAYNRALKGKATESDINLLKDKLPIKIKISYESKGKNGKTKIDSVYSFIDAKTQANQSDPTSKKILELQTMPLRENLINELIKNKSFKGLSGKIVKQYPGLLKVEKKTAYFDSEGNQTDSVIPKNDILKLQVFDGMTNEEAITYFQKNSAYVDWSGNLVSTLNNKKVIRAMSPSNKGEVFLRIPRNDGSDFWLKLNVSKVSEEKSEAVFEMIKALSAVSKTIKSPNKLQGMTIDKFFEQLEETDAATANRIMSVLEEEIELVKSTGKGKAANNTLSRLIDLVVYHKSKNTKTAFNLTEDGNLELGSLAEHLIDGQGFRHKLTITKDELDSENAKSVVMKYLAYKRNNIMITTDSAGSFVFNNKAYIEYLLGFKSGEPILTTNAVVGEPTFQGYSNIYLSSNVNNSKETIVDLNAKKEIEVKKANIEKRRQDELDKFKFSTIKTNVYDIPIFLDNNAKVRGDKQEYMSRELFDIAYANDNREGEGFQTAETLIRRGGYTKEELTKGKNALLRSEIDKINAKYDAEIAALSLTTNQSTKKTDAIDLETANEDGTLPSIKVKFQAALNGNKTSSDNKVDVNEVKDLFDKGSEAVKAEAIFQVAEFLNVIHELENVKEKDMSKFFYKMIEDLNKQGKTVSEQKKICGF